MHMDTHRETQGHRHREMHTEAQGDRHTQRETQVDTQRHRDTGTHPRETQRHRETHTDRETHTTQGDRHTQRDTGRHRETQTQAEMPRDMETQRSRDTWRLHTHSRHTHRHPWALAHVWTHMASQVNSVCTDRQIYRYIQTGTQAPLATHTLRGSYSACGHCALTHTGPCHLQRSTWSWKNKLTSHMCECVCV